MNEKEIIKLIIKNMQWNQAMLAEALGYKGPSGISNRLRNNNDMSVQLLVKVLGILGYQLTIESKSKHNKSQWIVSYEEEE